MKSKLFPSAGPAILFLAGNIFLFQPAIIYWGNLDFFAYGFGTLALCLLPFFLCSYALLLLSAITIPSNWRRYYTALLTGIAFSMWASTLFTRDLGIIDGKSYVLYTSTIGLWVNGALLFLLALVGIAFSFYNKKVADYILLCISAVSALFVVWVIFAGEKVPANDYNNLRKELVSFSSEKNVLLLLLDTFQADFFQELLKKNPSWAADFSGFTYYPEAISSAPGTYLSIAAIHSGDVYKSGETVASFYEESILQNSFVKAHVDNGYKGLILNPYYHYCPKGVICGDDNEAYFEKKAAFLTEGISLIKIACLKSAPHALKLFVYNRRQRIMEIISTPQGLISNNMLSIVASSLDKNSSHPTIKLLHLYGTHPPAIFNETCQRIVTDEWNRELAINQDNCATLQVLKVLTALKKKDIYNNTAIMIMADHGAGFPDKDGFELGAAANPLFLYKPFNAYGQLKVSNKIVGLIDIPATICATTNDCNHPKMSGYDVQSNVPGTTRRNFHFNSYAWKPESEEYSMRKPCHVKEYEISGSPKLLASWHRVS